MSFSRSCPAVKIMFFISAINIVHELFALFGCLLRLTSYRFIVMTAIIKTHRKADTKWFFAVGVFRFFLYMIAFNKSYETITAERASVSITTIPVITVLPVLVIYGERLGGIW